MRSRLSTRDLLVTVIAVTVAVVYAGYVLRGRLPLVDDVRAMAAVGLLLGLAAVIVDGRPALGTGRIGQVERRLLVLALLLGLAALISESTVLLVPFMASLFVLWAIVTLDHAGVLASGRT